MNSCTEEKKVKCKLKVGIREGVTPTERQQKDFEHLCRTCLQSEPYKPDARFDFAMFIHRLQKAGLQFGADDIKAEEWFYLEQLKQAIDEYQNEKLEELKKNVSKK